ncbi:hypothetical protein PSH03_000257 [Micromonospora sp. PSH03]|nr:MULTISPECIES: hypothetical protein [Micromonospora]MBQ0990378.1 hypothetical protein [Micromonospora sp. H61]MCG5454073.1 hypothetical protein [Micromonospora salmantinae]
MNSSMYFTFRLLSVRRVAVQHDDEHGPVISTRRGQIFFGLGHTEAAKLL